jgi:hypothetical protein
MDSQEVSTQILVSKNQDKKRWRLPTKGKLYPPTTGVSKEASEGRDVVRELIAPSQEGDKSSVDKLGDLALGGKVVGMPLSETRKMIDQIIQAQMRPKRK